MPTKTVDLVNPSNISSVLEARPVELIDSKSLDDSALRNDKSTTVVDILPIGVPSTSNTQTPLSITNTVADSIDRIDTRLTSSNINLDTNTNINKVDFIGNQVRQERNTSLEVTNQAEFNFYNEQLDFGKSTVTTPPQVVPDVIILNDNVRVTRTNNDLSQEVLATSGPVPDILSIYNPEDIIDIGPTNINPSNPNPNADVYIEPTNVLQDLGINNTPLLFAQPGFNPGNIIRDILTPGPTNVLVSPPLERVSLPLSGTSINQFQYDEFGTGTRLSLKELEENQKSVPPSFTGNVNNRNRPAVDSNAVIDNFVPGTPSLDVATAPYFLQSVISTPAGSLPKGALWAVNFVAPDNDNYYNGGLPTGCINQIKDYEPQLYGEWNINNASLAVTKASYNGSKGCMFAQSVQTPSESYQAQPDGGIQRNGLIQSYVGQGRNLPSTLKISFLETNVDFVDNIIRPWIIMCGHLGLIARTGMKRYRTNVRFYKLGLASYSQPPTVLAEYFFRGVCPVSIDSTEYTYSSDNPINRKTVEFIYHSYVLNTSKNNHSTPGNIGAGGTIIDSTLQDPTTRVT